MVKPTIIRTASRLPQVASDRDQVYPVLPIQTGVLFPRNILALRVRRSDNLKLMAHCQLKDRQFVAAYAPSLEESEERPAFHQVGVLASVQDSSEAGGGVRLVTITGHRRVALERIVGTDPHVKASVVDLQETSATGPAVQQSARSVISVVGELANLDPSYSQELLNVVKTYQDDPSLLADHVAATLHFPLVTKQELLSTVNLRLRLDKLLVALTDELTRLTTIRVIQPEPAEPDRKDADGEPADSEPDRIRRLIASARHLPPEVVARATVEADRLAQLSSASAEYGSTKIYLERLLNLPWGKFRPNDFDVAAAEKIIDTHYYGPGRIKERVLQRLAVLKLQGGEQDMPTLCLVGPPGTGKASLAKALARAIGREFIRVSVGGVTEVAEIKGSPRAYVGALPGLIVRALKDAGSCDPVVLVEDIDYFNIDNDASVNAALLEMVDGRHNSAFLDEYLGVPFDLGRVFFICSVQSYEEIPEQFVPRFELLEIPGYIDREKIAIAKKFILPEKLKKHGIARSEVKISEAALSQIVTCYTQESGLMMFSQQIEKICRKLALNKVRGKRSKWTITENNLSSFLGPTVFIPERAEKEPEIGIAAGLAWTGAGGDLMFIEGLKMKGEGDIMTTGSLGEVMKESIQAAHSYVRSKSDMLGIDFDDYKAFDIHIHFPSGAIPKDGPSAGVTVCLVLASVMAERPIRNDVAMTGEITLRGKVLPVGGIKEKVAAAYRSGISHVALPKENKKDLKELPAEILRKCTFTYLERVDELFELCLLDFKPSTFTLQKVLAEEIEKVKQKAEKAKAKRKARASTRKKSKPKAAGGRRDK